MRPGNKNLRYAALFITLALATLFIYAGFEKLEDPLVFADSVAAFAILPAILINLIALSIPPFEIACGLFLLWSPTRRIGALAVVIMSVLFFTALSSALLRGLALDCGCFGIGAPSRTKMWFELGLDVILGAAGLLIYKLSLVGSLRGGDNPQPQNNRRQFQMKSWVAIAMFVVPIFLPRLGLANDIKQDLTSGPYRIELEVLPPEPFYSVKRVAADEARSGMLALGGAQLVQPEAPLHPNYHLVVHVFQTSTGKALTNAKVHLSFHPLGSSGKLTGSAQEVPVVRMQMIMPGMSSMEGM